MEWIQTLNKAIDYIEENLSEDIDCNKIAAHVCISSFHFQRTFNLLTDLTIGEYIRNRRLSLAGQELIKEDVKIIDIALKYGYETPESFSKAFKRFHGITPNQAKRKGENLKSFNRLIIKIQLIGGSVMDYKIIKKDVFKLVIKSKTFNMDSNLIDIPLFWDEYFKAGLGKVVCGEIGICIQENIGDKEFKYGIGEFYNESSAIPEGFEILEVPSYDWAVFKCVGAMPNSIQDLWKRVYSEWLPQSSYELIPTFAIEYYTEGDIKSEDYISEVWIPVIEK